MYKLHGHASATILEGIIDTRRVATLDNYSDMFTKALADNTWKTFCLQSLCDEATEAEVSVLDARRGQ
eukprot:SAG22_NODE_5444_length_1013_cov_0.863239_2_plen_68_part_00